MTTIREWAAANWKRLFLVQLRPSENMILLALAVSVGLATGGGVWLFRKGIDFFQRTYREGLLHLIGNAVGPFGIVIVLALAGLVVGWGAERVLFEEAPPRGGGRLQGPSLAR